MKELVIDVETTGATNATKGNPFCQWNKLCYAGLLSSGVHSRLLNIEYDSAPYGGNLDRLSQDIRDSDILIGFNFKFDLNWLARYDVLNFRTKRIWDCQLFEHIVSRQQWKYPSLKECLEKHGLPQKPDNIKLEYWDKGIDTDEIPKEELEEYLESDLTNTYLLYKRQQEIYQDLPHKMQCLIRIVMQDLLMLREIEFNGLKYDFKLSISETERISSQINTYTSALNGTLGSDIVNWGSNDHVSAVLYGGIVKVPYREQFEFTYKNGKTKIKERNAIREVPFERMVEPLPKTELKKAGFFQTGEKVLVKIAESFSKDSEPSPVESIISYLLARTKAHKLDSTYYSGYRNIYYDMGWEDNLIHGNMNQCVTISGRLSSTKPNKQNIPPSARSCILSRFK